MNLKNKLIQLEKELQILKDKINKGECDNFPQDGDTFFYIFNNGTVKEATWNI